MHLQLGTVLKCHRVVPVSPVGSIMRLRVVIGLSSCGGPVVNGLEIGGSVQHGACSIASAEGVQRIVISWNQFGIETKE